MTTSRAEKTAQRKVDMDRNTFEIVRSDAGVNFRALHSRLRVAPLQAQFSEVQASLVRLRKEKKIAHYNGGWWTREALNAMLQKVTS